MVLLEYLLGVSTDSRCAALRRQNNVAYHATQAPLLRAAMLQGVQHMEAALACAVIGLSLNM